MSKLSKDYEFRVVYKEVAAPSAPPPSPPSPSGPLADTQTLPYTRIATWQEVRGIWPWLSDSAVEEKITFTIHTTPIHGSTIYRTFTYYGPSIRDGGPLRWEWIRKGYLAVQWVVYGGNRGLAFCVVVGQRSDVEVFTNPIYNPDFRN